RLRGRPALGSRATWLVNAQLARASGDPSDHGGQAAQSAALIAQGQLCALARIRLRMLERRGHGMRPIRSGDPTRIRLRIRSGDPNSDPYERTYVRTYGDTYLPHQGKIHFGNAHAHTANHPFEGVILL